MWTDDDIEDFEGSLPEGPMMPGGYDSWKLATPPDDEFLHPSPWGQVCSGDDPKKCSYGKCPNRCVERKR